MNCQKKFLEKNDARLKAMIFGQNLEFEHSVSQLLSCKLFYFSRQNCVSSSKCGAESGLWPSFSYFYTLYPDSNPEFWTSKSWLCFWTTTRFLAKTEELINSIPWDFRIICLLALSAFTVLNFWISKKSLWIIRLISKAEPVAQ